ncbi:MAG TPA: Bax inhibitor-1/YccA family protein [Ignavibacteriales bacterium]|nr:Bax inhibitor-1/YccA family protein [Ignavibacteriales bacterium]
MSTETLALSQVEFEQRSFITKVYGWMSFALLLTGLAAYYTATTPSLLYAIYGNQILFFGLIIGELLLVVVLSAAIKKLSAGLATSMFIAYAILTGLTLSFIFILYTASSIALTFFVTAGTFAAMSVYGYTTKRDLTSWGNLLFMGLIGIIIGSLANLFMKSETMDWIITYVGIIIFTGLIAYDTQKIKEMNIIGNEGTDEDRKEAIMGALALYLDFINLFLKLLRVLGKKK